MGKKLKKIFHKIRSDHSGVSLVELIVVFALLGIFMVSASQILLSSSRIYYKMKGIAYARQVSENVMTKVVGMVESAQTGSTTTSGSAVNVGNPMKETYNKKTFVLSGGTGPGGYKQVDFYDRTGSQVSITADDAKRKGYLNIHYQAVVSQKTATNASDTKYEATDWYFDKNSYMGFHIKELSFSRPSISGIDGSGTDREKYATNIIRIKLVLTKEEYGEYTDIQYVECYNFDRIKYTTVPTTPAEQEKDGTRFKEQDAVYDAKTETTP